MTTRYRVEYALKTHRRDQFIEWIKGLLAVPFVLSSQPAAAYDEKQDKSLARMARSARQRYADVFRDIEALVLDHIKHQDSPNPRSKLKMLVPSISNFFTPLALEEAFIYQDDIRAISSRRFVPPSFNDIRLILNTAQVLSLVRIVPPPVPTPGHVPTSPLRLLTFDGDVTLYEDGGALTSPDLPIVSRLLHFLARDVKIGIVTAAGYTEPSRYYARLSGLLDAVRTSKTLTPAQKRGLIVMGGESNFLFVFDEAAGPHCLRYVNRRNWILPVMESWNEAAIQRLLDVAEQAFRDCITTLRLPAEILRKERAVGIYPPLALPPSSAAASAAAAAAGATPLPPRRKFTREQLEETVLVVQQVLEADPTLSASGEGPSAPRIPFCAFNGGNDVFVDIGDKSLGVQGCQKWFGGIGPAQTLHVGDQFLSGGGNDFKARLACTTSWIASPDETLALLDEMIALQLDLEPR